MCCSHMASGESIPAVLSHYCWAHSLNPSLSTHILFLDFAKHSTVSLIVACCSSLMLLEYRVSCWFGCRIFHQTECRVLLLVGAAHPGGDGVPQRSILGPLLFIIYINDFDAELKSNVCLFVDNCVVYYFPLDGRKYLGQGLLLMVQDLQTMPLTTFHSSHSSTFSPQFTSYYDKFSVWIA